VDAQKVLIIIAVLGLLISGFVVINNDVRSGLIYTVLAITSLFLIINWRKVVGMFR
jgi:uncharacterized membrane protein